MTKNIIVAKKVKFGSDTNKTYLIQTGIIYTVYSILCDREVYILIIKPPKLLLRTLAKMG